MNATSGNARQEKIRAKLQKAVFKKFKQPVCQFRYIFFASRNLDIVQSVISRGDLHTEVTISRSLLYYSLLKEMIGIHYVPFILIYCTILLIYIFIYRL